MAGLLIHMAGSSSRAVERLSHTGNSASRPVRASHRAGVGASHAHFTFQSAQNHQ
jgi:hypothetical protein